MLEDYHLELVYRQKVITGILKNYRYISFYSKNKRFYSCLEKNTFFLLSTFNFDFFTKNKIKTKGTRLKGFSP